MNSIYNEKMIANAETLACNLHKNHTCIFTNQNKIYHIKSVVREIKNLNLNNNALIILAYLHDSLDYVEYDKKAALLKKIEEDFGEHIAELVVEVSDNFKLEDISTQKGIEEFKARIIEFKSPGGISDDSAKIILAEKVCNLTGMMEAIKKGPEDYWERLSNSHKLKKEDVELYYKEVYDALSARCYGTSRLRTMIDKYDDLIYRIFN